MALFTCAGATVLRGTITFPAEGLWVAALTLEAAAAPNGAVSLEAPGMSLSGLVARGGSAYERTEVRVVAAPTARTVTARPWANVPLRLPLADVVAAAGAKLATDIDAAILATRLDVWLRANASASQELEQLAAAAGCVWRAKDDGAIWLGTDSWPELEIDHRVIEPHEGTRLRTIALEDFSIRPGVVLDGMRVARVIYRIERDRVRCDVLGEP